LESALRAAVAERLGELRFSLWFGEDVHLGLSGDGDALEVQVPNAFFREWIRGHFSANLVEAAQAVTGRQVRLSFAVQNEIDPPLGDVVDPDSDRSQQRSGSTVTVPIPGDLKAPLSFPAPHPASPDNTRDQAWFYIEHMGGNFASYQAAHDAYHAAITFLHEAIPRGLRVQSIGRFCPHLPSGART